MQKPGFSPLGLAALLSVIALSLTGSQVGDGSIRRCAHPRCKEAECPIPPSVLRKGKDFALFFAVNDYANDRGMGSWPDLSGPIKDAEEIARTLEDFYRFDVEIVRDPTYRDIQEKLSEYRDKAYAADGQLFLFFSGHGHFLKDQQEGFFIPKDGKRVGEDLADQTWVSLLRLPRQVNTIPCPHILMAIDACYSGTIDAPVALKSGGDDGFDRPMEKDPLERFLTDRLRSKSRIFCTSGGNERTPDPSEFARQLKTALNDLGGRDALLTVRELEDDYFFKAVPRPRVNTFEGHEPGGAFIFVYKGLGDAAAKPPGNPIQPPASNVPPTDQPKNDRQAWLYAQKSGTAKSYRDYLSRFPTGEFAALARKKLSEVDEDVAWQETKQKNTPDAYREFMDRFPKSAYNTLAKEHIAPAPPKTTPPDKRTIVEASGLSAPLTAVPGGVFDMGDVFGDGGTDELPVHRVQLRPFHMGRTEVAIREFKTFVAETKYKTQAEQVGASEIIQNGALTAVNGVDWRHDEFGRQRLDERYPVVHVSWLDAVHFCNWLSRKNKLKEVYVISGAEVKADWDANGYRLPTEAEWEYAARSGGKRYPFAWGQGNPNGNIADEALQSHFPELNVWGGYNDGFVYAAQAGLFEQGDLGLCDITGNVLEWCWDWYEENFYQQAGNSDNPHGPSIGDKRVVRGGHWRNSKANLRVTSRAKSAPEKSSSLIGFRVCRNAD
ncbi:MAG: SUMF1/EgtB/PvdO family nonheme iron enzyme [Saprospiraceae bacterium]|nr:SUMF1/EgtB/PvdO family nonheme iron enzyme [Saprospiraceae bacterium]